LSPIELVVIVFGVQSRGVFEKTSELFAFDVEIDIEIVFFSRKTTKTSKQDNRESRNENMQSLKIFPLVSACLQIDRVDGKQIVLANLIIFSIVTALVTRVSHP